MATPQPSVKRRRDGAGQTIPGSAPAPAPRNARPAAGSAAAAAAAAGAARTPAANVIAQLVAADGTPAGPQLDLPADVTPPQLQELLNTLLRNEEPTPYAFYVADVELADELGPHLAKSGASVEGVLRIVYQPQALFRVAPVTRCSSAISGHAEAVLCVAFSPDGKHLASGSGDTTVRFWDLGREGAAAQCAGHKNWVMCVAWSPDGAMLASGGMDGEVRLWQPGKGNASVALLKGHRKGITSLAWEPAHLALPCRRVASGARDNTVRVWDATLRRCLFTLSGHSNVVSALKWGGDGLIYSASRDTAIHVWETGEGKLIRTLKGHGHWVNTLALSSEYALRTGAFNHRGEAPAEPEAAKAVALERYTAACGGLPERLVSGSDDFTMFLWVPSEGKAPKARMTGHVALINQVLFSPDGRRVASACFDKAVKLWDGLTGAFLATLRAHVGPVYGVAWSADSRMLCSASRDSTLKLWEARSGRMTMDLPGHEDEVYAVDWAPAGGTVASGGKDKALRLWKQ